MLVLCETPGPDSTVKTSGNSICGASVLASTLYTNRKRSPTFTTLGASPVMLTPCPVAAKGKIMICMAIIQNLIMLYDFSGQKPCKVTSLSRFFYYSNFSLFFFLVLAAAFSRQFQALSICAWHLL